MNGVARSEVGGCDQGCGRVEPLVIVISLRGYMHDSCAACARQIVDPLHAQAVLAAQEAS